MTTHNLVPWMSGGHRVRPVLRAWGNGSLDRTLADLWGNRLPTSGARSVSGFVPRIDVDENDEAVEVRAELPGLEEKDFEVLLNADILEIKGEREETREDPGHRETSRGSFQRKLRLAFEPDPEA